MLVDLRTKLPSIVDRARADESRRRPRRRRDRSRDPSGTSGRFVADREDALARRISHCSRRSRISRSVAKPKKLVELGDHDLVMFRGRHGRATWTVRSAGQGVDRCRRRRERRRLLVHVAHARGRARDRATPDVHGGSIRARVARILYDRRTVADRHAIGVVRACARRCSARFLARATHRSVEFLRPTRKAQLVT